VASAALLALALHASVRFASHRHALVELEPARLVLTVGETREVRLVVHAAAIVALALRLGFDERIVQVEGPELPVGLAPDGSMILLPVRRTAGRIDVDGVALTGGRTIEPGTPFGRFIVRAIAPGAGALRVEDLRVVEFHGPPQAIAVAPLPLTVRGP
jgi:uncharacterized protein (DUF58 family)